MRRSIKDFGPNWQTSAETTTSPPQSRLRESQTPRSSCGGKKTSFRPDLVPTCVGKRSRASDTLCRRGRPLPFPQSPFTRTLPPPSPPSESDEGETCPEASVSSISRTHGGFRSTWKSAEILQLLETSKRARLMKNGSTYDSVQSLSSLTEALCQP